MSSSPVIPKEQLSAYQRWELNSFDGAGPHKNGATILPTAEQVERIYQQAQEEGRAAGYQEGKQQAETEARRLQALLSGLEWELQQFDQQVAQDLLTLALDVAKQMLGQALKVRPELVLAVVQEAVHCLPHSTQHAHLILHPDDAALVRSHLGDQLSHSGWKIHEDMQIGKGGCRVETGGSQVDATLPTRWQGILSAIGQEGSWLE
jgi:flagellar assembly protein FliH